MQNSDFLLGMALKSGTGRADGLPYFWWKTDQMEMAYLEVYGSNIKSFEFKWNPKKTSRVTKAFTNRSPDAEVETITPENFGEWVGWQPCWRERENLVTVYELGDEPVLAFIGVVV